MLSSFGATARRIPSIRAAFRRKATGSLRKITITCRGNPISEEELFRYTNGHFLINEESQCQRRYVKFNVPQLCDVAAISGDTNSPVLAIEKMEGGFCKALLMRKVDGTELVAKLPSKLAGPSALSTASEVATLKYVREHTTIPVPRVLAWSSDSFNQVGSEYIIMEKAPGVQLYKKWGSMDGTAKLALTKHLVELESQLASIHFPVSGSLYLRDAAMNSEQFHPLCKEIDPGQSYCIGPSVDRSWCVEPSPGTLTPPPGFGRGPWTSLLDYGSDLTQREIFRLRHKQTTGSHPYRKRSTDEEIADLEAAMKVIERIESNHAKLASTSTPILWHTDLHLGNIYVSEEDPTQIASIIDWQSISIGPSFLQVTWPEFLKPTDEYTLGVVHPQLPDNFDQLDKEEQAAATSIRNDAIITKSYEIRSLRRSPRIYHSLNLPSVFRELFVRSGEAAQEGTVGLRACLAELFRSWSSLGLTEECPLSLTQEELLRNEQDFKEYRDWHDVQEFARDYLDTDADGWVSPEFDFVEVQQRNKAAFERYMQEMSKQMAPHDARRMWPFLEGI